MFIHVLSTRAATWWLECRSERLGFYGRLGFHAADDDDVPPRIRELVRGRTDRRQNFMTRAVASPN